MLGFGTSQALRLGSNLLLTRMLPREAFGVMLLVQVVLQGLERFSDLGVGTAIIQNPRDDRRFLNTAWTLQSIRGAILGLCAGGLAWPAATFFQQPALLALIPFAGLSAVFAGLQSTKFHTANRKLMVGRVTLVNLAAQVTGIGVTFAWAVTSPTAWALAAGGVATALATFVFSYVMIPGPGNGWTWDRTSAAIVMNFGKWVFVSTLLSFFAMQSDRIVFGRLFDAATLGVYAIATLIADAPQQLLRRMALRVEFPLYSQTLRDGRDLAPVFQRSRRRILILGGAVCALLVAGGAALVGMLYADAYAGAGWMVQIMAIGTWFNTLTVTLEAVMLAQSRPRVVAGSNLVKVAAMLVAMLLGHALGGFEAALVGLALSEVVRYVYLRAVARSGGCGGLRQELVYTAFLAGAVAIAMLVLASAEALALPLVVRVMMLGAVVVALWLPVALPRLRSSMILRGRR